MSINKYDAHFYFYNLISHQKDSDRNNTVYEMHDNYTSLKFNTIKCEYFNIQLK